MYMKRRNYMSNKSRQESFVDKLAKIVASMLRPFVKLYRKGKEFEFKKPEINVPEINIKKPDISLAEKLRNCPHINRVKSFFDFKDKDFNFDTMKDFVIKYKIIVASVLVGIIVCAAGTYHLLNTPTVSVQEAAAQSSTETAADDSMFGEMLAEYDNLSEMGLNQYVLRINGEVAGYFSDKTEGEKVLELVKAEFSGDKDTEYKKVYFKENVSLEKENVKAIDIEEAQLPEDIASYIVKGTDEKRLHKIQKGENFWLLAKKYNIKVDDLVKANPDVSPETIQIGQEISLVVPKPLISVVTVEEKELVERLPRKVEYIDSESYYKGEYKVKTSGKDGERKILAEIYKENGIEVNKVVLSEEILVPSEVKVMYRGIKNPPPRIGSGVFARPLSRGVVTSPFGMRWGRLHAGIDIGVPTGTPITAADGGKVTFAGNNGGYGLLVMIDHGGNFSTRYGHNSKLLVKKGDRVYKGQKIALSGNTGRSTGPHLHFEIRKNGTPINPAKYVKF